MAGDTSYGHVDYVNYMYIKHFVVNYIPHKHKKNLKI
jgi:hypothetical protein